MIVITSATSVTWAGASRIRSSRRELRSATWPEKTRYPIATAFTVAIRTAPAAMSLASFASGEKARGGGGDLAGKDEVPNRRGFLGRDQAPPRRDVLGELRQRVEGGRDDV